jgi:hypothetical protein
VAFGAGAFHKKDRTVKLNSLHSVLILGAAIGALTVAACQKPADRSIPDSGAAQETAPISDAGNTTANATTGDGTAQSAASQADAAAKQ